MRVTFVTSGFEHLGVEALSAYLRAHGHETRLVYEPKPFSSNTGPDNRWLARLFEPGTASTAERVLASEPDLVAFSTYTVTHAWSLEVARAVRRSSPVPIVFGGAHASGAPRETIEDPAVDAVVEGEGEGALLDLVESVGTAGLSRTDVANCWFKTENGVVRNPVRPLIDDLDSLPFVDRSLFYEQIPSFAHEIYVMARRGCPYRCSFCEYSSFPARYDGEKVVRRRSVPNLIAELRQLARGGAPRKVFFWDAIFTLDHPWMREFAAAYARDVALPFECYTHPSTMTPEMARLLARAGCSLVRVGVQSVNGETLARLDRRGDARRVTAAIHDLDAAGIDVSVDHILGLPGESAADQRDAIRLYCDLAPKRIVVHWMTYFPGTTAFDHAVSSGAIVPELARAIRLGDRIIGFEAPSLLGGGADASRERDLDETARLEILLHAMALLPPAWIRRLLESDLHRRLPRGLWARHLVSAGLVLLGRGATRAHLRAVLSAVVRGASMGMRHRVAGARAAALRAVAPERAWTTPADPLPTR